jgi:predicted transcriptional regulator of viral defense system
MAAVEPLEALPDVFTYSDARRVGLSDRQLYALRDAGAIGQLGRGLFRRADSSGDPDLLEIAARAPEATLCLASALARHGLTDEIPARIDVALPRTRRQPTVHAPLRWHRFEAGTFDDGRDSLDVGALSIGIYSAERSICDAFRLRHLEGAEQAVDALKRWLRRRGSQPAALLRIAPSLGPPAEAPIREALDLLL